MNTEDTQPSDAVETDETAESLPVLAGRPPFPNRHNGRGSGGRFTKGNPGGPGNPYNAKVQRIRATLLKTVKTADIRHAVERLIQMAKGGDLAAIRELLDRCIGRPASELKLDATVTPPVTPPIDLSKLSVDDLRALQAIMDRCEEAVDEEGTG